MTQPQIVSAARFFFQSSAIPATPISELKNISSMVEPVQYIYADAKTGEPQHTKQYGMTKPPSVTFVTGLDPNTMMNLFAWHEEALKGNPSARQDTTITLSDNGGTFKLVYLLEAAWCAKVDIGGAKAGATEQITVTVTLECDKISCSKG